jgi:hypothetical protein
MDCPSCVDRDTLGIGPVDPALSGGGVGDFSGTAGGSEDIEVLVDDIDNLGSDSWVLLLNLEGSGWLLDSVLSLLPLDAVPLLIKLFLAVLSNTFFSVNGKYSVRCVVISSLGGLWPKKLRNLDGFLGTGLEGPFRFGVVGDTGSSAFSGSRTPRPLRTLTELARLVLFPRRPPVNLL